ncbi:caspase family protein [Duganella violaceipulchra]|uniref:Filamentous hemagglutinin N-terminal domain-containing protein n=1 Tax=Duganella violaceipulchra TaxID=2849652 RepID=A0AA41HF14_9BURK|nr:caspase family protein [Duganella violaceicalia]MBV6324920.1 filamentous hemagglutinin N-terminal domain-containing protein [Duganella violaceicalia]MCP2012332.1 filamentous hemagglutinin family protein [Duganella violaceicalia]
MLRLAFLTRTLFPHPCVQAGAVLLTVLTLAPPAQGGPLDPTVRAGTASFAVNGNVFTVTNTPNTIIDWRQFNVANGELLRFLQQNAQSTVLNRVTGVDPSQILGALQSNGRVLLVNPNGVLFGANATVDVAGLVASSLRLSDADFLAGKYNFAGGAGGVHNFGAITTPLGGSVYLVGGDVSNGGVIRAPGGQILLAAGQRVSLADSGAPNLSVTLDTGGKALNLGELNAAGGRIDIYGALIDLQGVARADSSARDALGRIVLKASGATSVAGAVSAANSDGVGGSVQLLGDSVSLGEAARIDASGSLGGGSVLVGGDYQGRNAALQNASRVDMAAGARITASAGQSGDGGKVVLWSRDQTSFAGSIVARGGALGGDGGQVETSGHTLQASGYVDTLAPRGRTGNWLLDPAVFCFYTSSAGECSGPAAAGATDFNSLGNLLVASNGTLQASDFVTFLPSGGSASVNPAIPAGLTLTVQAPYIEVGRGASINTGVVGLKLDASSAYGSTSRVDGAGASLTGSIVIGGILGSNASQALISTGGNIRIGSADGTSPATLSMGLASGTQSITTTGNLDLTAAVGAAQITTQGEQTIHANRINLLGSNASGATNVGAGLIAGVNQTVQAGEINLLAGSGGGATIWMPSAPGGKQTVDADRITLTGGAAGLFNNASINASGLNVSQTITAGVSLTLNGGAGGAGNIAQIRVDGGSAQASAVQKITAGAITVNGGISSVADDTRGNNASLDSAGSQVINADSITINGGSTTVIVPNYGASHAFIGDGTGGQSINVTGAIKVNGGSGLGRTAANIYTNGNQSVKADSITVTGGSAGANNFAEIGLYRDSNVAVAPLNLSQTIVANSISLQGGADGASNTAMLTATGVGVVQKITTGDLVLKGGSGSSGNQNRAFVSAWDAADIVPQVQIINAGNISVSGGGGTLSEAYIGGKAVQTIVADNITLRSGAGSGAGARITTNLDQTVSASHAVAITGGSSTDAAAYNAASINSGGKQNFSADVLTLTGGDSGSGNRADLGSGGDQVIAVKTLVLTGGKGGNDNTATLNLSGKLSGKVQRVDADSITLLGGAGTNNTAGMFVNGPGVSQLISAPVMRLTGGAAGSGNTAQFWANDDSLTQAPIQTVTAGALTLTGGASGVNNNAYIAGKGTQTVKADSILLQGGGATNLNAYINTDLDQVLSVQNAIVLQGGSGGTASMYANGNQSITAASLSLAGSATGSGGGTDIGSSGNQTVTVQSLAILGGSGGDHNHANLSLNQGAGHTQTINADSIVLQAGAGTENFAGLHATGAGVTQRVNTNSLTIKAGSGVSGDWAHLWSYDDTNTVAATQVITGGAISLTGGETPDSNALIGGNAHQTISADTLRISGGTGSSSGGGAGVSTARDQSIAVRDALTVSGGTGANQGAFISAGTAQTISAATLTMSGGSGSGGASANVNSGAGQRITVSGALTLNGGAAGVGNRAQINLFNNVVQGGLVQEVVASSVILTGGAGGSQNTAQIIINANGGTQNITAPALSLIGGQGGTENHARIHAFGPDGITVSDQNIKSDNVSMLGGGGSATDANNWARFFGSGKQTITATNLTIAGGTWTGSSSGISSGIAQTITVSDTLSMRAGTADQTNVFIQQVPAEGITNGAQTISAHRLNMVAGADGSDRYATIAATSGTQTFNLTGAGSELTMSGGGSGGSANNKAIIYQVGSGTQKFVINGGGAVKLRGGNGDGLQDGDPEAGYCPSCRTSNNLAAIYAFGGGDQILDFVAGGTLDLAGGKNGSDNSAVILADLSKGGHQTVTSSGGAANYAAITLTGGSGGYYNTADGAMMTNVAALASFSQGKAGLGGVLKTINAKSITLDGGGTPTTHGGALLATGQGDALINVTGDLTMTGGASSVALQAPADPATAFSRDQGAVAAINPDGSLTVTVGGNLSLTGGSGASGDALIHAAGANSKLSVAVGGATRLIAGASSASIVTHTDNLLPKKVLGGVLVDLGGDGSLNTSTFAASGQTVELNGTINATGSAPNATLLPNYTPSAPAGGSQVDWTVLGAKNLQAEIYASDAYTVRSGGLVTPNGNWIVALGKNAAAALDPAGSSTLSYELINAHGYSWSPAVYDSGNAAAFRFLLPEGSPVVDLRVADAAVQSTCTNSPAMCASNSGGVSGSALPGAAAAAAPVTYDARLALADATAAPAPASAAAPAKTEDGPAGGVAGAKVGFGGKREATREKEVAQAADDKKSTQELKREAREASGAAKADLAGARKAELAARKDAGQAKQASAEAAKVEAQAKRAEALAKRAEADGKQADSDARKAEAEVQGAPTPALKVLAQAKKADADARRAGFEAKVADANAKKAEAGAKQSEAGAKRVEAEALGVDARARTAAAEAKMADAARSEALAQAREAKSPQQRAAAERVAGDKRVEVTQKTAESRVRQEQADDLRLAASQAKDQADARRSQAQASVLEAGAKREEALAQVATARSRKEEAQVQRAEASGKPELVKAATGAKAAADRQLAVQTKKAEAQKVAAAAKAEEAKAKQAKADAAALVVAKRDEARRAKALKAFAATATAAMSAEQLAELSVLRHEHKTAVFKEALKILEHNAHAADLPPCGPGAGGLCVPNQALLQTQLQAMPSRPALRLPSASFLPQIERKVAVVIGINHYQDERIPALDSAVPDAEAVATLMAEKMGYEVHVLRDATRADIVNGIGAMSRELGPKDSLAVYYAGHGYMTGNAKSAKQGYWIPSDGSGNSPANWISTSDVSKLLASVPARQVMLVSDSCYSGTFAEGQKVAAGADANQILGRRSVVVMSSGGEEPVADDGVEGHSIFAWSLMNAMKRVTRYDTGNTVFDATKAGVTEAYPQVPQYGAAVSAGHTAGGDYLFETRSYK